jgi:hypothetical protein
MVVARDGPFDGTSKRGRIAHVVPLGSLIDAFATVSIPVVRAFETPLTPWSEAALERTLGETSEA